MKRKGFLVTIASPSGGGKSTICREILRINPMFCYSVSWTTRAIRGSEVDGVDYFFTDIDSFQRKIEESFFLEYAVVHGNYYGTSIEYIESCLDDGKIVLLDIDVQGVELVKIGGYDIVSIFMLPPNEAILRQRLVSRQTDSQAVIEKRLENSKKEIDFIQTYDYLVINDEIENTVQLVNSILVAEQNKVKRYVDPIEEFYR